MAQIKARKPKPVMSDEHKALRGDVENDLPYWVGSDYNATEWNLRKKFEAKGTKEETYGAYVSDLTELEV